MGYLRLLYKYSILICTVSFVLYLINSLRISHQSRDSLTSGSRPLLNRPGIRTKFVDPKEGCDVKLPLKDVISVESVCQLKPIQASSCQTAETLFFSEPSNGCETVEDSQFCNISSRKDDDDDIGFACNFDGCHKFVFVGYFDVVNANKVWTKVWKDPTTGYSAVYQVLTDIIKQSSHSGYLFIKCVVDELIVSGKTQLLLLPVKTLEKGKQGDGLVNVNLIFIDSVSYYHFHRSMPQTVKFLSDLRLSPSKKVLGFPMFQSVKSRTFENLQALFSGEVDTDKTFATQSMPLEKLQLQKLLKPLKERGYSTLFLEDLCWFWEWGISKDLLVHNKTLNRKTYWTNLLNAFKEAAIDSYGISPSSCEILDHNGKPDPFHGLESVCFNGKFQHEYFLDYLLSYQDSHIQKGIPFFSFYMNNVGHDDSGRRVQTLDKHLFEYLQKASEQSNTMTIILSDHGNTYGSFVQETSQGKDEIYHPLLYMIMPADVQYNLRYDVIQSLEVNQGRLLTMLDLHHLLRYITAGGERLGLAKELPSDRTCADLKLYQPNICLCKGSGFDAALSSTVLKLVAEFAAGYLSNHIFDGAGGSTNAKCRIILANSFSHPQITSSKDGQYTITMNIHFNSTAANPKPETILAAVRYRPSNSSSNGMQLMSYERVTKYSVFQECSDGRKFDQLCVCDGSSKYLLNNGTGLAKYDRVSHLISHTESHELHTCVTLVTYRLSDGAKGYSVYLANVCTNGTYSISYSPKSPLLLSYSAVPRQGIILYAGNIQFVLALQFLGNKLPSATELLHFSVKQL